MYVHDKIHITVNSAFKSNWFKPEAIVEKKNGHQLMNNQDGSHPDDK